MKNRLVKNKKAEIHIDTRAVDNLTRLIIYLLIIFVILKLFKLI